jgi:hypothetical protein
MLSASLTGRLSLSRLVVSRTARDQNADAKRSASRLAIRKPKATSMPL